MTADWEANCLFVSDLLEEQYPELLGRLRALLDGTPIDVIPGTADIWCRDYMPIQLGDGSFCQFIYNPDYLRGYEHLITPAEKCRLPPMTNYRAEPIVLDGGNVVCSRSRAILTEKVYGANSGIERPRLRKRLAEIFQAECIFIPKQGGDQIGHSDGVVRFINENRVVMSDFSSVDAGYGDRVRGVLEKNGLHVETLPMFEEPAPRRRRDDIESAVGIYVNYLRVGDVVVLPGFDRPEDENAVDTAKRIMPGTTVCQVLCRKLAERGGVLNCISWTIKTAPPLE